jgi:bifunctional UDP-N-acetylglucosamine pyrophosphorylase/glucosamine-1-phosphate N-acetyltransferase
MLYGDDLYSGKDLKKCLTHKYCVLAREVKDPQRFGVLKLKGGRVTGIVEKPKTFVSTLANCGGFVLDKKIFDVKLEKTERGEYEATDFINSLAGKEKIDYERVEDYWIPIGYPWSLLEANELLMATVKEKNLGRIEKGATIKGPVQIGSGTIVKSGSYIEGPVIIGEDCEIGPNCYLRKGTTVGHRCKIGQATEVKNTIIMDDSKVPHLSYIGDSVIGEHVNLGAGTITANLRHDSGSVKSMVREQLVDTGRRKLGAIIGDHVHTGINTSIFPGRKIWPNKTTQPGEIVTKDVM